MPEQLYALKRPDAVKLKRMLAQTKTIPVGGNAVLLEKPQSIGFRFFKLLEDVTESTVLGRECNELGQVLTSEATVLTNWLGIINDAKAGYVGLFAQYDGKWVFVQGPCVAEDCDPGTSSILLNNPPDTATVGQPYYHTIVGNDLDGAMVIDGLPPGMAFDGLTGVISGSPNQGGEFTVVVSGISDVNSCVITEAFNITVSSIPPSSDPGQFDFDFNFTV